MSDVTLALESPRQGAVIALIRDLDAYLEGLYPAESNHQLDIDALAGEDVLFLVARGGAGEVLGFGALRLDGEGFGEVKRMYVRPEARGRRIGRRVLDRLEAIARDEGIPALRLETGIHQAEAIGLYRAAGFAERPPFGAYAADPLSLFMEKVL